MMQRRARVSLPILVACLTLIPSARAEEEYAETIDVNVVNVEVVVTDREGRPVTGLTRDDFELYEDGKKVELSNFYAVGGAAGTPAPGGAAEVAEVEAEEALTGEAFLLPADVQPAEARPAEATRQLNLVVLVDQLNLGPRNRKLLFEKLRAELRGRAGPDVRVMVASLGSRMEIVQPFTEDLESVLDVLDAEQKKTSTFAVFDGERRMFLNRLQRANVRQYVAQRSEMLTDPITGEKNLAETAGDAQFDATVREALDLALQAMSLAEARTQRVRATIEALSWLCDGLREVPGRKALLYLSDGLPARPAAPLLEAWTAKYQTWVLQNDGDIREQSRMPQASSDFQRVMAAAGSGRLDLDQEFERLGERASVARVAFYPISNSGRAGDVVAAGESGSVTGVGGTTRAAHRAEVFSREASLMQLAEATGGLTALRSANLGGLLERVRRDFTSFYSLGFSSAREGADDAFHELEIKVRGESLKVRHVKGYRERSREAAEAARVAAGDRAVETGQPGTVEEREALLSEIIDVRVVNFEVVVTDKEGRPIEGLTREDFEISEDGRQMELSNFFEAGGEPHDEAPAAGDPATSVAETASAELATGPLLAAEPAANKLHLVLFVDNLNIRPQNRALLFESLRDYLEQYRGQEVTREGGAPSVMVVTMGHSLKLAQPFTRDLDQVLAVIDEISRKGTPHMLEEGQRKMLLAQLDRASLRRFQPIRERAHDSEFEEAIRTARNHALTTRTLAEERYQKVEATLEGLGGLCDALGGLAGRKALIYLSDGLPLRPADSLIAAWAGKYEVWFQTSESDIRNNSAQPEAAALFRRLLTSIGSSQFDLQSELNRLTVRASDNRVAFYPISSSGRLNDYLSAEYQGNVNVESGMGRRDSVMIENFTRDNALMRMAEDTGGVAVLRNANLARLLEQVESDFHHYYSLGYSPPPGRDDFRFHNIQVRVLRPGTRVRHLKGYRHKNWRQRLGEMTTAAALFAVESNPLGVRVARGDVIREEGGFRVPLTVKIPFQRMQLVHKDKHFNANLTVLVMARDEDDKLSDVRRFDLPVRIPDDRVLEVLPQVAAYPFELTVPKGTRRVAVGVRDHLAQTEATVKYDLVVEEVAVEAEAVARSLSE